MRRINFNIHISRHLTSSKRRGYRSGQRWRNNDFAESYGMIAFVHMRKGTQVHK